MVDYGKADLANIPLAKDSLVKIYRVACHRDKVVDAIGLCEELKEKGYIVSIQLMGVATYTDDERTPFRYTARMSSQGIARFRKESA